MAKRYIQASEIGAAEEVHEHDASAITSGVIDAARIPAVASAWSSGDLKTSARATPETGWLLCDGAAISRTTYADLFDAIGVLYGPGNGTSTFNLPDFRGRTIIGAGDGPSTSARVRGDVGGAETHTLTETEMPAHTHSTSFQRPTDTPSSGGSARLTNVGTDATINTSSRGSSGAHNNMQPYGVANVFIKE